MNKNYRIRAKQSLRIAPQGGLGRCRLAIFTPGMLDIADIDSPH
jgi:hypothetical protein